MAVGLWPFCILLFLLCPMCTCVQLVLVPVVSLYSFELADVCQDASTAAKHPRPQSVSGRHYSTQDSTYNPARGYTAKLSIKVRRKDHVKGFGTGQFQVDILVGVVLEKLLKFSEPRFSG